MELKTRFFGCMSGETAMIILDTLELIVEVSLRYYHIIKFHKEIIHNLGHNWFKSFFVFTSFACSFNKFPVVSCCTI